MKIYRLIIAIILLIVSTINCYTQKNISNERVKLGEFDFSLQEIPINKTYKINSTSKTEVENGIEYLFSHNSYVFCSSNKKFFLVADVILPEKLVKKDLFIDARPSTKITFYDKKGAELWNKEIQSFILHCRISNDGEYIYTIQGFALNGEDNLICYNKKGKQIKKVMDVEYLNTGNKSEAIYYQTKFANKNLIGYVNPREDLEWEIEIQNNNYGILAVSDDEQRILYFIGNKLFSANNKNKTLWEKECEISGGYTLSENGKFLLVINGSSYSLIDNNSGQVLLDRKNITLEGNNISVNYGCFVHEGSQIVLAHHLREQKTILAFYDLEGNFLNKRKVDKAINESLKVLSSENKKEELYYFDGILELIEDKL